MAEMLTFRLLSISFCSQVARYWLGYVEAYNRVSMNAANRKFGRDVFKESAAEAIENTTADGALQMKAIARRLGRLEDQLGAADRKPRKRFRVMIRPMGRAKLDLKISSCQRTLCAGGTVSEHIVLVAGSNGRDLTDVELEEWVAGFTSWNHANGSTPHRLQEAMKRRSAR